LVDAWFGNKAQRSMLDAEAHAHPTLSRLLWAWRLAGRACDQSGVAQWGRAIEIGFSYQPTTPVEMKLAPGDRVRAFPLRYPAIVWKVDDPHTAYVAGTWTYSSSSPLCAETSTSGLQGP
jgi:hypothetical protein